VLSAAVHQQRRARAAGAQHGLGRCWSSGSDAVLASARFVEADRARMRSAPSVCIGVPSWLAHTSASRSGGS
jgi:hypothetical protein